MPIYCELPIWGDIFEPLNTVSNLAFIVAAYFVWRLAKKIGEPQARRQQLVLAALIALVGIGSFLWHYFRTPWGVAIDATFINVFLVVFTWYLVHQIFSRRWSQISAFAGFVAVGLFGNTLLRLVPIPYFGELGGTGYLMPLLYAIGLAVVMYPHFPQKARYFLITLGVFLLSLIIRQLDVPICELTHGHGLHLFWHVLNGYVLYRLARTLIV